MEAQTIDKDLAAEIVTTFKNRHNSKKQAVKTKDLLKTIRCLPQTFRDILGEIRRNGLIGTGFIVSDVHIGYWYTEDRDELNDFLQKQLNRISNQYANIEALHNALKNHRQKAENLQQTFFDFN